jgi:intraflagellar transport protein 172
MLDPCPFFLRIQNQVGGALMSAALNDKAGELFERGQMPQRALDAYRKGHVYNKAVELARQSFPNEVSARAHEVCLFFLSQRPPLCQTRFELTWSCFAQVVPLEAAWGEYLVSQRQLDQAIPHFIEAVSGSISPVRGSPGPLHIAPACWRLTGAIAYRAHTLSHPPRSTSQGRMELAIEAAIGARQWAKAAQVVDMQDEDLARPYYKQLADHYAQVPTR